MYIWGDSDDSELIDSPMRHELKKKIKACTCSLGIFFLSCFIPNNPRQKKGNALKVSFFFYGKRNSYLIKGGLPGTEMQLACLPSLHSPRCTPVKDVLNTSKLPWGPIPNDSLHPSTFMAHWVPLTNWLVAHVIVIEGIQSSFTAHPPKRPSKTTQQPLNTSLLRCLKISS